MAIGDIYSGISSINAGSYYDLKPASGYEAIIHNIYHESDVEVYYSDGTNNVLFDTMLGSGAFSYFAFHVNYTRYIRVKNVDSIAKLIGFDGIYTKVV